MCMHIMHINIYVTIIKGKGAINFRVEEAKEGVKGEYWEGLREEKGRDVNLFKFKT